ncbi:MAG TPA: OpgC domain-containing protein [Xanthobacteraceae bacterium]
MSQTPFTEGAAAAAGLRSPAPQVEAATASAGAPGAAVAAPAARAGRDLRLDLFRGLALWLIFLDHVPNNILAWFTIRNYGFSDATEIFIFISGYTAAFVYGNAMVQRGFVIAGARILKRAWQIYVAHVFLFAIFIAEISYVASSFDNPLYAEEMNALDFLKQPEVTIIQALLLKFKPVNMDVLPLYIVLLLLFPLALWLLIRNATVALLLSVALYSLTWEYGWNIPSHPTGHWFFNPFAWQLLFVFGAWCALGGAERLAPVLRSPVTLWLAIGYLLFCFGVTMTWYFPRLSFLVPRWLGEWMYPIDKTNLDVLRFAHFLALAALTVRFIPRDWPLLQSRVLKPAILCGQHSLEIFCLGVFLAFAAHFIMVEFFGGTLMQIMISMVGILLMVGTAALISWYKKVEGRGGSVPRRTPDADLAGGEA